MCTLASLRSIGMKRYDKYETAVVDVLPALSDLDPDRIVFTGTFSMSQAPRRWLQRAGVIELFDFPQTPAEVTRDYLSIRWPDGVRRKSDQILACAGRHPPQLAVPGYYEDVVYVDLRAAYWSIVAGLGWDADYWPCKWLARGADMGDYPLPHNKAARNYLVSIANASGITGFKAMRIVRMGANRHANVPLWGLVHDVLHAIALYARDDCHAVYVNVDGYIVPGKYTDRLLAHIADWGLTARVEAVGRGEVHAVGNYAVGDRKTLRLGLSHGFYDNISEHVTSDWLQRRVSALIRPIT